MQYTTRQVYGAQVNLNYIKKRARKEQFEVLSVTADTKQEVIEKLNQKLNVFMQEVKYARLLEAGTFICSETDYGDNLGKMVSIPLLPKVSNCSYEPLDLGILTDNDGSER